MQYKVPQNVDIEDKVIGPLTLRQFLIVLTAVGIMFPLYFILIGPLKLLFWMIAILFVGGAVIIAFAKYGDQNFEIFLLSALKTIRKPRKRVWKKLIEAEQNNEKTLKAPKESPKKERVAEEDRSNLEKLAVVVDSGGNIPLETGDRIIPFGTHTTNDDTPDILGKTEREAPTVDPLIEASKVTKGEPLISDVASLSPNQKFDYPKVETKDKKISRF